MVEVDLYKLAQQVYRAVYGTTESEQHRSETTHEIYLYLLNGDTENVPFSAIVSEWQEYVRDNPLEA